MPSRECDLHCGRRRAGLVVSPIQTELRDTIRFDEVHLYFDPGIHVSLSRILVSDSLTWPVRCTHPVQSDPCSQGPFCLLGGNSTYLLLDLEVNCS